MAKLLRKGVPSLVAFVTSAMVLFAFFGTGFRNNVYFPTKFATLVYGVLRWFTALYAAITLLRALKNLGSSKDISAKVIKSAVFLSFLWLVQAVMFMSGMNGGFSFAFIFKGMETRRQLSLFIINVVWSFVYSAVSRRFYKSEEE